MERLLCDLCEDRDSRVRYAAIKGLSSLSESSKSLSFYIYSVAKKVLLTLNTTSWNISVMSKFAYCTYDVGRCRAVISILLSDWANSFPFFYWLDFTDRFCEYHTFRCVVYRYIALIIITAVTILQMRLFETVFLPRLKAIFSLWFSWLRNEHIIAGIDPLKSQLRSNVVEPILSKNVWARFSFCFRILKLSEEHP